jgi:hypothetical protein
MEDLPAGSKLWFDDVIIKPRVSSVRSANEIEIESETIFSELGGDARRLSSLPVALSMPPTQADKNLLPAIAGMRPLIIIRDGASSEAALHGVEEGTIDPCLLIVASEAGEGVVGRIDAIMPRARARCILVEERSGSTVSLIDACNEVRRRYPNHILIAGEIQTSEQLKAVARDTDTDIVMLAAPWSSGAVGVPSFAMTSECAREGRVSGVRVMANVEKVDDVPKALAAGADFVAIPGTVDTATSIINGAARALRDVCMRTDCRHIKDISSRASFLACKRFTSF